MITGSVRLRKLAGQAVNDRLLLVESECGAVAVGEHTCCRPFRLAVPHWFDPGSVSTLRSSNRDMQISRIRLSDKTSRFFACNAVCSV
jgi:hypothetical protein